MAFDWITRRMMLPSIEQCCITRIRARENPSFCQRRGWNSKGRAGSCKNSWQIATPRRVRVTLVTVNQRISHPSRHFSISWRRLFSRDCQRKSRMGDSAAFSIKSRRGAGRAIVTSRGLEAQVSSSTSRIWTSHTLGHRKILWQN